MTGYFDSNYFDSNYFDTDEIEVIWGSDVDGDKKDEDEIILATIAAFVTIQE